MQSEDPATAGIDRQPTGTGPQPACAPRASGAVAAACFRVKVAGQPAFAGERTACACRVPADEDGSWQYR